MPICHIEAPPGIRPDAKKKMMEKITAAIEEGYQHIGDTFIFLHEDKPDYVMMNGRLASEDPKYESFQSQSSRKVGLVSTHRPRSGWGQTEKTRRWQDAAALASRVDVSAGVCYCR